MHFRTVHRKNDILFLIIVVFSQVVYYLNLSQRKPQNKEFLPKHEGTWRESIPSDLEFRYSTKYVIQVLQVQYVPYVHDVLLTLLLLHHNDHKRHLYSEHAYTFHNDTPNPFADRISFHKKGRLSLVLAFGS